MLDKQTIRFLFSQRIALDDQLRKLGVTIKNDDLVLIESYGPYVQEYNMYAQELSTMLVQAKQDAWAELERERLALNACQCTCGKQK